MIRERDAEIARLRADARSYANVMLSEENDRLIAEIDRLRAVLREKRPSQDMSAQLRLNTRCGMKSTHRRT